jgi:hypothetical protein
MRKQTKIVAPVTSDVIQPPSANFSNSVMQRIVRHANLLGGRKFHVWSHADAMDTVIVRT